MRTNPTLRAAGAAAALTLALAACAQDDDPVMEDHTAQEGEPEGDAAADPADVEFVQGMIPHHVGAVEMAEMVPDRTDRPELIDLAEQIIADQEEEIEQMRAMLDRFGAEEMSMDDMDGMDHDDMGMMSEEEMDQLRAAEGEEFERLFLEDMIVHHQGAITMAEQVLAEGSDPEAAALADDVIAAQEAEIEQMNEWLGEWDLA